MHVLEKESTVFLRCNVGRISQLTYNGTVQRSNDVHAGIVFVCTHTWIHMACYVLHMWKIITIWDPNTVKCSHTPALFNIENPTTKRISIATVTLGTNKFFLYVRSPLSPVRWFCLDFAVHDDRLACLEVDTTHCEGVPAGVQCSRHDLALLKSM